MQEGATDYYELDDEGCCLVCEDSEEGCLCYNCKCSKCYWYSDSMDGYGGPCDLAAEFRGESEYNSEFCHVGYFTVLHETERACLLSFKDGTESWIPKRFLKENKIQRWILDRKGLSKLISPLHTEDKNKETISLKYSSKPFVIVKIYQGQELAPDEMIIVNPKDGIMYVVKR